MAAHGRAMVSAAAAWMAVFGAIGCGGSSKKAVATPQAAPADAGDTSGDIVPQEKFDEIKNTFDSEAGVIGRCFPKAVSAGELKLTDKGYVTVEVTITPDGRPTKLHVAQASLNSKTLDSCVLDHIRGWTFTTLPKSLLYSYTYTFERL